MNKDTTKYKGLFGVYCFIFLLSLVTCDSPGRSSQSKWSQLNQEMYRTLKPLQSQPTEVLHVAELFIRLLLIWVQCLGFWGVYILHIYIYICVCVCVCPARRLMLCCVALPSFHRSCHRSHRSCHRFKSILVTFVFNCCGMDCNWKDKNWNLVTILCTPNSAYLYMECMHTLYMFVSLKHPFILLLGTRPSQGKWFPA